MEKYVYELHRNATPIYVGESKHPQLRYRQHIYHAPAPGCGMFYGQTDLELVIVAGPMSNRDARDLEDKLKTNYSMVIGERIGKPKLPPKPKIYTYRKKLTEDQMVEIRQKYKWWDVTLDILAKEYGVSSKTIHRAITQYK